jgi:hypothetical protein
MVAVTGFDLQPNSTECWKSQNYLFQVLTKKLAIENRWIFEYEYEYFIYMSNYEYEYENRWK